MFYQNISRTLNQYNTSKLIEIYHKTAFMKYYLDFKEAIYFESVHYPTYTSQVFADREKHKTLTQSKFPRAFP